MTQKSDPEQTSRARNGTDIDPGKASSNRQLDIGGKVRVARLDTLKACRAELGKLYREARKRAGKYPAPLDAKRLADVLAGVRGALEMEELEKRLQDLENSLQSKRQY